MASLSQKRGIWYLWIKKNGKRRGISLKTRDYQEALVAAEKLKTPSNESISIIKTSQLFEEWESWNSTLSSQYVHISSILWKQLTEYFSDRSIGDYTARDLNHLMSVRRQLGDSETYLGIRMRTYKAIFNWARKQGYLATDIFLNITMPKRKSRTEFLSSEEIDRLLEAAKDNLLYQCFIRFMLATGCRRGELYNLKWTDIKPHYMEFNGKTGRRSFPMKPHISDILDDIRSIQNRYGEYVFSDKRGKHFKRVDTISKFVKRCMKKAGLSDSFVAHSLRHTFASHLVLQGMQIYTLSKLLGHSNIATTEKYAHLSPERVQADIHYF